MRFADARPIAKFARDLFLKGEVDEVKVVATVFLNTMVQSTGRVGFSAGWRNQGPEDPWCGIRSDLVLPTLPRSSLSQVRRRFSRISWKDYLNIFIYRALLEAKASEQSARMVAMKNATDNASGLINDLTLEYNTLRQGNITKELLEIAGGQLGNE